MHGCDDIAREIRVKSLELIHSAGSGHPGGCLSVAEILATVYSMKHDGDSVILSKGHSAPALYAVLDIVGEIEIGDNALRAIGSPLQGHPSVAHMEQVVTSTGSLGQGLGVAVGVAIGKKLSGDDSTVYCIVGDGEMQEGIVWESLIIAGSRWLNNLVVILDNNGIQGDSYTREIAKCSYAGMARSAGFNVIEVDGHGCIALGNAIDIVSPLPKFIIANTVKGKGVSWMEDSIYWHGSVMMSDDELSSALAEVKRGK